MVVGQIRRDHVVADAVDGPFQNIDVPEDAREAELVLILQIGAVAPLENQNGKQIRALLKKVRHIELRRVVGDLAVAHVGPVEPDVEAGIHAFKIQERAGCIRVPVPGKAVQVGAAGIVLGDVGRIEGKRVADVGVLGAVVASQLPAEGHRFLLPPFSGLVLLHIKRILQIVDAGIIGESPRAPA